MTAAKLKRHQALVWLPPRSVGERAFGADAALVVQTGDQIHIAHTDPADAELVTRLASLFTIPRTAYRLHHLDAIPRNDRGKVDYRKLEREL